MKEENLDKVFEIACDTVIEGMTATDEDAVKHKPSFVKRALELLTFADHEIAFEHSESVRQVAKTLELVSSQQEPPEFDELGESYDTMEEGYG